MRNSILIGAILCAIASMSWGAMFPVADHAFQYIDPFYFTIIRYLPVTVLLVVFLYFIEGKQAFKLEGHGFMIWFFGTMGFTIYNLFIFWGQNLLGDAGVVLASIMEALAPIISILIVWILTKKRPYTFTILTVFGAFIGVLLVVTNGNFLSLFGPGRLIPLIILFSAAACWALYNFCVNHFPILSVIIFFSLTCLYSILYDPVYFIFRI